MIANLKALISKLDNTCRKAAEQAVSDCTARGHFEVDFEHLFLALLENAQCDFSILCQSFEVNTAALESDLQNEITKLKSGNGHTPVFSVQLPRLFEQAWLLASLDGDSTRIRSGHLLLALLVDAELSQLAYRCSPIFMRFSIDKLKQKLAEDSVEYPETLEQFEQPERHKLTRVDMGVGVGRGAAVEVNEEHLIQKYGSKTATVNTKTPALDQYTSDLTARARAGLIDPVIGRDAEIRQMIDILMRRRQNNPILTGEAGVGKTAVVEGLAQRIATDDVPVVLQGVALHVLDLGLLQAGASVKGEFENRLRGVIDEVKRSAHPIILFIDEAHTMIGAGGQAGQNDAANLLKPALARGELRTIAATTWSEYKKYFEKDAALARRFQVVKIDEPSEALACTMLRGMVAHMENHFQVRILEEAVIEAVRLSARYMSGRQLPDKAIGILDTACARVALGQSATPATIEDADKRDIALSLEIVALEKESAVGAKHAEQLCALRALQQSVRTSLTESKLRWQQERRLVTRIQSLRNKLEGTQDLAPLALATGTEGGPSYSSKNQQKMVDLHELNDLQNELHTLQGTLPLVPVCVDAQTVGEIVSAWTGIPLGKMIKDEIKTLQNLQNLMTQRVIGQPHALAQVAQRVRTARANLGDPHKPKAVFLFVGPSGVGKTETALALADVLYGGERNVITINMSEYQEAHAVAGLKGSPPGYVGYGEGGVLTEAVRRKPYSVVLLDEVEKAHPDVLELFFQVFDKGVLDDAEGREVDFKNTIIILTSNIASQTIMQACLNQAIDVLPNPDALLDLIRPQLFKAFKPAFLGRLKVVPYYPLPDEILAQIIRLKISHIQQRVSTNHRANLRYTDAVVDAVLTRCTEVDSGARNVDHILNGSMLPEIADLVLARMAEGKAIRQLRVDVDQQQGFSYRIH